MKFNMRKEIWIFLILSSLEVAFATYVTQSSSMKCSYGERGSLTSTCVNAVPSYFRATSYKFDQLDETVKCVDCNLTTIESGTFDISGNQIMNLILSHSKIEKINPKGFVGLIFLEKLILSYNNIRSIFPGTFEGVKKIKTIDLSYNQLEILSDDGFAELVNLEELIMDSNAIQTIATKAFNGMNNIKILSLKNNKISEIKKEVFSNLTSLSILDLEHNSISTLGGAEFTNLTGLAELNLAHNLLSKPVIEFNPKNYLRNLFLQFNQITTIGPKFLTGLRNLENLDLSYNQIENVNIKSWENMFQLRHLNMSYNKIISLQTGTFSGLPQMELLNVSHNQIVEVRITGVFSLHSLHALDLSHNNLTDLDYVGLISRLPRLSYLELQDNRLPCGLESEMEVYFEEDNFKYVLYNDELGSFKCTDEPVKNSLKVADFLVGSAQQPARVTGAEVTIIVLMTIIFVCIGFLFFMQYRTYHELARSRGPNRSTSSANLVNSEILENGEDNYLQE